MHLSRAKVYFADNKESYNLKTTNPVVFLLRKSEKYTVLLQKNVIFQEYRIYMVAFVW